MAPISDSVIYLPSSFSAPDVQQQKRPVEQTQASESKKPAYEAISEYIPAYPDDSNLDKRSQRQNLYQQTDKNTQAFLRFSSDDIDEEAKGRFVDLHV